MRRTIRSAGVAVVVLLAGHGVLYAQSPVGTVFTYQGQLKEAGSPATGDYDFVFRLFDAEMGGAQIGSDFPVDDWPVSDGLFTVQVDFGAAAFGSEARWIEVAVRPGASGDPHTVLSPRQPVTPAPVALYALDGPGSAGYWAENGTAIYNTNSGRVGIQTSSPLFNLHVYDMVPGGSNQPPTTFGVQWKQAVYPTPPDEWFYFVVGGSGPTVGSGTRLIRESGTELHFQTQDGIYSGWPSTQMMLDADGKVGIGTSDPTSLVEVVSDAGVHGIRSTTSAIPVAAYRTSTSGTWPAIHAECASRSSNATAIRAYITDTSPGSGSAAVSGHNHGTTMYGYGVKGSHAGYGTGVYGVSVGGTGVHGASTDGMGVYGRSTSGYAGYFDGTVRASVLEITGADLAEKFPVSDDATDAQPGTVMEIDPENPGKLRVARGAYNRRVAGVVSGAGDIPAGTILGNLPGSEDAPPIALGGRVWVHCDASQTAVETGDLLTTSNTPGHAMAVRDFSRAHGAVIGKAMTPLARGETGLVLVLVSLQ